MQIKTIFILATTITQASLAASTAKFTAKSFYVKLGTTVNGVQCKNVTKGCECYQFSKGGANEPSCKGLAKDKNGFCSKRCLGGARADPDKCWVVSDRAHCFAGGLG